MTSRPDHLASLDIFRGMTVAGMILVNNPGNWSGTFESLTHADWNGCTFADLVFPFFVFILGAAMPFSFARRVSRDDRHRDLYVRIAQRSAWLIALGLMLNVVAAAPTVVSMRLPGVLQRIGLVYLLAAPIIIHARSGWRLVALGALVLGHWALLTEPILASAGGLAQTHNLAGSIDRSVFGSHTLTTTGDPEGLLGTMPAVGTALLGSLAGDWLRETHSRRVHVAGLVGGGLAALGLGLLWATVLPLNKSLWTGSYVLFTGGIATLMLAICYLLFDVYDYRRWAQPLSWLGFNPLAIYFLAELCGHLLDAAWPRGAAQQMTLRAWIFWDLFRPLAPDVRDEWLSLAFALVTVACWTTIAGLLHHRRIRIQV